MLAKDAVGDYWAAGHRLILAKEQAAHGDWLPLLQAEDIAERTARRAMQFAREFDSFEAARNAVVAAGGIVRALPPAKTATVAEVVTPAGEDKQPTAPVGGEDPGDLTGYFDGIERHTAAAKTTDPAAADQAEQREPPEATPVTEPAVDELAAAEQRVSDLEDEVRFWQGERSKHDHEREALFNRQQAVIASLRSSVAEWQTKYADLQRSHRGAIKRIKELEGNDE